MDLGLSTKVSELGNLLHYKTEVWWRLDSSDEKSLVTPSFQEKLLKILYRNLYPRTNTGGQEENSKVSEITMVKELGKMTP